MTATIILVALAACLPAAMTGAWLVALRTGQSGWIDAIWSFATGCFAAAAALVPLADNQISVRQVLVAALALVWSLRLGIHIAVRTARGGEDDPRYRQLREEWGDAFKVRLLWFLQIQALVGLALALRLVSQTSPGRTSESSRITRSQSKRLSARLVMVARRCSRTLWNCV